jgi:GTP-binding protein YchF
LTPEEHAAIRELFLLTAKPVLYIANVSEGQIGKEASDPYVKQVMELAAEEKAEVVVLAAALESEIQQLPPSDRPSFLESAGLTEPGLHKVVRAGYKLLGLQTYFTVGPKECRAWTFHKGWRAPQCAGVIHSDFERGFIKAEVMGWQDLLKFGSESAVREKGLLRVEGKEYVVQDGDCMHFRFNV